MSTAPDPDDSSHSSPRPLGAGAQPPSRSPPASPRAAPAAGAHSAAHAARAAATGPSSHAHGRGAAYAPLPFFGGGGGGGGAAAPAGGGAGHPGAPPQFAANGAAQVVFQTQLDVLMLRLGSQLAAATHNAIRFSARRYGFLVGQLRVPSRAPRVLAPPTPTSADNFEERLFLCMSRGAFSVERALVVYRTSGSRKLAALTLLAIADNFELCGAFARFVASIVYEISLWVGAQLTQKKLLRDFEYTRQRELDAVLHIPLSPRRALPAPAASSSFLLGPAPAASSASSRDAVLEAVTVRVLEDADRMSLAEMYHFEALQTRALAPLHRLLRLCMSATLTPEQQFVESRLSEDPDVHVWDLPADTPASALPLHLKGALLDAVTRTLLYLQQIAEAAGPTDVSRRLRGSADAVLEWLLEDRTRAVYFSNLAAFQLHCDNAVSRTTNVQDFVLQYMRAGHVQLACQFARLVNPQADVRPWLARLAA